MRVWRKRNMQGKGKIVIKESVKNRKMIRQLVDSKNNT